MSDNWKYFLMPMSIDYAEYLLGNKDNSPLTGMSFLLLGDMNNDGLVWVNPGNEEGTAFEIGMEAMALMSSAWVVNVLCKKARDRDMPLLREHCQDFMEKLNDAVRIALEDAGETIGE